MGNKRANQEDKIERRASALAKNIEANINPYAAQDLESIVSGGKLEDRIGLDKGDIAQIVTFEDKLEEIQAQMPEKSTLQKVSKIFNYVGALSMIITAVLRFVNYNATNFFVDGFYSVFTCYLIIFGVLLAAAEYQYAKIVKYFEFLISLRCRGYFMIFIGVLLFDNTKQVDLAASISLSLFGAFNIMVSCISDKKESSKKKKRTKNDEELGDDEDDLLSESDNNLETVSEQDKEERRQRLASGKERNSANPGTQ
jgi:hypothetical protein